MEEFVLLKDSKMLSWRRGTLPYLSVACLCLMSFLLSTSLTLIAFLRALSDIFTWFEDFLSERRQQ